MATRPFIWSHLGLPGTDPSQEAPKKFPTPFISRFLKLPRARSKPGGLTRQPADPAFLNGTRLANGCLGLTPSRSHAGPLYWQMENHEQRDHAGSAQCLSSHVASPHESAVDLHGA
jgi:hypothetical protein